MASLQEVYALFLASSGVETDSRKSILNKLFFALKGENFDGNTYALNAIEKGASAAIVDQSEVASEHPKCFLVDDVLQTLQALASHHRKQFDIPVIALTGSNGKTTTKELIASVLNSSHRVLASKGNLNNHIGVPLTLLGLTKKHSHALIEMGANHIGEIDFLCHIAHPTHGIITNIGKAHLEGFGSLDGVLEGKTELYRFLEINKGIVIINDQDPKLIGALGGNKNIIYSPMEYALLGDQPTLKLRFNDMEINTQMVGNYNKTNIAAAVCVGDIFDVPLKKSVAAIEAYAPENYRSQLMSKNNKTIVIDAYNANPTSMHAAIAAFAKRSGKKAVLLGHMAELGTYESDEHQALVDLVKSHDFEECYWVGKPYESMVSSNYFASVNELHAFLKNSPIKANQLLIKGSRSAALEKVLDSL